MSNRLFSPPPDNDSLASPREYLLALILFVVCILMLTSCGSQVILRKDGTKIANVYAGSESTLEVRPDGTVIMHGSGEKGAEMGIKLLKAKALMGMGETVIKAVPGIIKSTP